MIDIVNIKCTCGKTPVFGLIDDDKPTCCVQCKKPDMVDIKNKKCDGINPYTNHKCTIRGHIEDPNNDKLKYCYDCFYEKYPNHPRVRLHKAKESYMMARIIEALEAHPKYSMYASLLVLDKTTFNNCGIKRRPDGMLQNGTSALDLEIDENGHDGYIIQCEDARLSELHESSGYGFFAVLRFNPDGYTDKNGVKRPSCLVINKETGYVSKGKEFDERFKTLMENLFELIEEWKEAEQGVPKLVVKYLYYDGY